MILFHNFISPAESSKTLYLTKKPYEVAPKIIIGSFTFFTPMVSSWGLDLPASYADAQSFSYFSNRMFPKKNFFQ